MQENVDEKVEIQFQYQYKYPLLTIASAFLRKYNWESRLQLSTVAHAEQVNDDRVVIWRRHENNQMPGVGWEKITLDRHCGCVFADNVIQSADGTDFVFDRSLMKGHDEGTVCKQYVYDSEGQKTAKVELFKKQVERVIKTIKFDEMFGIPARKSPDESPDESSE